MAGTLFRWEGGVIPVPGDTPLEPHFTRVPPFSLEHGKVTVIEGESGVGKSFFLSALVGLTDPGTIATKFHALYPLPAMREFEPVLVDFIYVPQFPAVRRELKSFAECRLVWTRLLENVGAEEQRAMLGEDPDLGRRFDLLAAGVALGQQGARLEKRVGELSGGQLKRFGLLLRLPFYAPILVLDEPDTGLDHRQAAGIIAFLRSENYADAFGRPPPAILMVTHNDDLQELADERIRVERSPAPAASPPPLPHRAPFTPAAAPAFRAEVAGNPLRRLEEALDSVAHRAVRECWHHLNIFLRSFQDFSVLLLSPILIFLLLRICEQLDLRPGIAPLNGLDPLLEKRFAKYAFFAVIAATWLGLQLYGKIPVADAAVMKEEFFWISNLRGGWRRIVPSHILGVTFGLVLTILVTSLFQTTVGAALFFWQPFGWAAHNWQVFPFVFIPLFCACCYGGMLGLALGAAVAWWQLDVWRPRRKPNLIWVNLLVPVIMLFQILFSHVYIVEGRAAELNTITGAAGRIAQSNVCARLCLWMEAGFSATDRKAMAENSKLIKDTAQACLTDGTILVLGAWLAFFVVVFVFCYYRVLQTPEVRRE